MIDLSRYIQSLSSFKRKSAEFIKQMKETGKPILLTVNGKAEVVVQDAVSFQKFLGLVYDAAQGTIEGLFEANCQGVIPPKSNRTEEREYHKDMYLWRQGDRESFPTTQYRAIATR